MHLRLEYFWAAIDSYWRILLAAPMFFMPFLVPLTVIGDIEIQISVFIIIQKRCTRPPARITGFRDFGTVAKRTVAIVGEEYVWAKANEVYVLEAVIVEIAHGYTLC